MLKYFSANYPRKFVDVIYLLVDQYTNTIHSSIKMTPKEASHKEKIIMCCEIYIQNLAPKFSIGDNVRITQVKKTFDKDTLKGGRKSFLKFQKLN